MSGSGCSEKFERADAEEGSCVHPTEEVRGETSRLCVLPVNEIPRVEQVKWGLAIARRPLSEFDIPSWNTMLNEFGIVPYGLIKFNSSVALVVNDALHCDYRRRSISVVIAHIRYEDGEGRALLVDPTGGIRGTITQEVLRAYHNQIVLGAVLLLIDVFAVLFPDRRGIGHVTDKYRGLHLISDRHSVGEVFSGSSAKLFEREQLVEAYGDSARSMPTISNGVLLAMREGRVPSKNDDNDDCI